MVKSPFSKSFTLSKLRFARIIIRPSKYAGSDSRIHEVGSISMGARPQPLEMFIAQGCRLLPGFVTPTMRQSMRSCPHCCPRKTTSEVRGSAAQANCFMSPCLLSSVTSYVIVDEHRAGSLWNPQVSVQSGSCVEHMAARRHSPRGFSPLQLIVPWLTSEPLLKVKLLTSISQRLQEPKKLKSHRCIEYVPDEQCETHSVFAELRSEKVRGKTGGKGSRSSTRHHKRILKYTNARNESL